MWTYFIFFLGILALVVVFIRRAVLLYVNAKEPSSLQDSNKESVNSEKVLTSKVSTEDESKIIDLLGKAEKFIQTGRDDEAIKTLVQALTLDADHLDTQKQLAMLYLQKQMFGAASALFKRLAELTQDPVYYSHLGISLYQQNSFEEARDAYQKAVTLDPSRAKRFVSLSQVYRALEQPQNAVIALNKALEIESDNVDFLLLLSTLHIDLEHISDAKNALEAILKKDPDNQDAIEMLKELTTIKDDTVNS